MESSAIFNPQDTVSTSTENKDRFNSFSIANYMQIDYVYATLLCLILGSLFGMAYYSLKMLWSMQRGLLEKSWRYLTFGATIASFGVIIELISNILFPDGSLAYTASNYVGVGVTATGTILFLLGFRSHSNVWNPKGLKIQNSEKEKGLSNLAK